MWAMIAKLRILSMECVVMRVHYHSPGSPPSVRNRREARKTAFCRRFDPRRTRRASIVGGKVDSPGCRGHRVAPSSPVSRCVNSPVEIPRRAAFHAPKCLAQNRNSGYASRMQQDVLGARLAILAAAISDLTTAEFDELSPSAAAALITIRKREPIAIQDIAAHVGLTHSATVRLIDRLEKDWLVRRLRRRGREVQVEATARGKRRARDIARKRVAAVAALTEGLDGELADNLLEAVEALLVRMVENGVDPARLCRFSDDDDCQDLLSAGASSQPDGR
ncbi:MAG: hypothetical protein C0606_05665 [Hyphomicrobiales bacterium]|nr:MAG: hypothetical protein C0606_05665 [Hyphomicrobiales bacterium]